ncbi:MAG: SLC13 family permease [Candidatus Hydrogenedentes bacterium]|nr:SLC13 family permease [Candidatus Hydrogenedentota bacterium]
MNMGNGTRESIYPLYKRVGLVLGPIAFLLVWLLPTPAGLTAEAHRVGAIGALMALWWITEAIPIAATSLIPLALFPAMGVLSGGDTAAAYGDTTIFLFAGGFFIAMAMEKWGLHERIVLHILGHTGANLNRLLLGFMVASASISLWVSNTATMLMMLPLTLAVITHLEQVSEKERIAPFATALLLGIAYASSIGGVGTLIGTAPNIILAGQYKKLFPDAPPIGFLQWMLIGIPFAVFFVVVTWLLLSRVLFTFPKLPETRTLHNLIADRLRKLGPMRPGEKVVLIIAVTTALGWIFRQPIKLGSHTLHGWSELLPQPDFVQDGTLAIFAALLLFVIPINLKKGEFALDWNWAVKIPWGILLLFGGGLALAKGLGDTGFMTWLSDRMRVFSGCPAWALIAAICAIITFATEITSNTAIATISLPLLAGLAIQVQVHPLALMIPATISASCAFMLPVATPPNAIAFSSGHLTIPQMARTGFLLNLIGIVLVTLLILLLGAPMFQIGWGTMPPWTQ